MMASGASAALITYQPDGSGTHFNPGTSLSLSSTSGATSTLSFVPNSAGSTGTPSGVNFGNFLLVCGGCTTSISSTFSAFTFSLQVTDTTAGELGSASFTGTSTGGTVTSNTSTILVNWTPVSPATLPPFGNTVFSMVSAISIIVAPNSSTPVGETTVQGLVSAVPEPSTFGLLGAAMIGLALRANMSEILLDR